MKTTKTFLMMCLAGALFAGATAIAQDAPPNRERPNQEQRGQRNRGQDAGQRGQRGQRRALRAGGDRMGGMAFDQTDMLVRLATNPNTLEEIGVEAALREKLQFGLREIDNEQVELQAAIRRLQQQQQERIDGLFADRENDGTDLYAIVDQIIQHRHEVAKLPVKRLIYLRDNLTDDQLAKARTLIQERQAQMQQRMEQFNARGNRGQNPPPAEGQE
ncbi:MAG: hypothetical protein ACOX5G_03920 [Kiritimatiellia bacterium]|jgi:hypothetical protein